MKKLYTRKLFYKKYNHRVSIGCRRTFYENKKPTPTVVQWLLDTKYEGEYRAQTTWSNRRDLYTVYFTNEEIKDFLVSHFADHIVEMEEPLNDDHTKVLEGDEKIITRDTLLHGKYRYIVRLPFRNKFSTYMERGRYQNDLVEWCKDQIGTIDTDFGYHAGTNLSFYFVDKNSATVFKLANMEKGTVTEYIQLLSEIESK